MNTTAGETMKSTTSTLKKPSTMGTEDTLKQRIVRNRKSSLPKILISGGYTISQQTVLEMREYFLKLSGGSEVITLESFRKSLVSYPYMKNIIISLYNRLDPKGDGVVTFEDFVCSYYPALNGDPKLRLMVDEWIDEIYQAEQLFERKERVKVDFKGSLQLLLEDPDRVRQSYQALDLEQKGFLNINNLLRAIGASGNSSENMLRVKFNQFASRGKLQLNGFRKLLDSYASEKEYSGHLAIFLSASK